MATIVKVQTICKRQGDFPLNGERNGTFQGYVLSHLTSFGSSINKIQPLNRGMMGSYNLVQFASPHQCYLNNVVFLRWLHFEKVVEALVANKIYHMELNELLKYTKRFCHIDKEDELKTMLKFYHDLGVIVKHGRTVVLKALWLIDLFKLLINVRPYGERVNSDTPHNINKSVLGFSHSKEHMAFIRMISRAVSD